MKIAAFPKCYLDDICLHKTMTVFDWIDRSGPLGAEGLEMYSGFFDSLEDSYLDRVGESLHRAGYAMPMLCVSPDFTHPDPDQRQREVDREIEMIRVARRLGGPGVACRVLSGQRYPEVGVEQGIEWVLQCIDQCLRAAREHEVILALENHYKDGYWRYPEFAQKKEVFLRIVRAIADRQHFGVQYDPSNATVAGDDPIELLGLVADRVVTMHASDRYLAPGAALDEMRLADGTIFRILSSAGYTGWVSIEDGMNGMDEMQRSIDFLKGMRAKYRL
jgi:sugar phosphate isomerase/epimerase